MLGAFFHLDRTALAWESCVSSTAGRTLLRLNTRYSTRLSSSKKPVAVSFNTDNCKNTALIATRESVASSLDVNKENEKRLTKVKKRSEPISAVSTNDASPSILELDYSEAAAILETIYKRSPAADVSDKEVKNQRMNRRQLGRKRSGETEELGRIMDENFVRSQMNGKRLSLEMKIATKMKKEGELVANKKHQQE